MTRLGHVKALDGIRGIAIVSVVGFHLFNWPHGGQFGVDLFFVLSGFLITTLLLEEHERHGRIGLRAFYVRRARRLLPALGVLLIAIAAIGALVYPTRRLVEILAASAFYAANFVRGFATYDVFWASPADHLWSLAQEEQFYLLWPPLLIVLLHRTTVKRILTGTLALFVALCVYRWALATGGARFQRIYFAPDVHADGLVIGCAAAFARAHGIRLPAGTGWVGLVVFTAAALAATESIDTQVYVLPIVELGAAALVLHAANPGLLSRCLSLRPLPWLGAISYSVYLWHQMAGWFVGWKHPWYALAATMILSIGSYYLVERPFRRRNTVKAKPLPALAPAEA